MFVVFTFIAIKAKKNVNKNRIIARYIKENKLLLTTPTITFAKVMFLNTLKILNTFTEFSVINKLRKFFY